MSVFLTRNGPIPAPRPRHGSDFPVFISRQTVAEGKFWPVAAHAHEEIELIAVLSGELTLRVHGCDETLGAGEGILINSSRIHSLTPTGGMGCELICVLLHPSLLCVNKTFERELIRPQVQNPLAPYLKLRADRFHHREIYEKIKWIHRMEREPYAPLWIEAAFAEIWANFCDNTPRPTEERNRAQEDARVALGIMEHIRAHCGDKLTLPQIAAAGGVGQSKCCKLFATYLGESPVEYLTRCRLEKSAVLLVSTDMPVCEVGTACGFGGSSYFAESFRARYGMSPTEYRKAYFMRKN